MLDRSAVYLDTSAIVKLIREERESSALRDAVTGRELFTCALALTEAPRALRRSLSVEGAVDEGPSFRRADEVLSAFNLVNLENRLLIVAGAIADPELRSLDAIHIAAAAALPQLDAFITYDSRQAGAAEAFGLTVSSP